jgi:hypothetical protein
MSAPSECASANRTPQREHLPVLCVSAVKPKGNEMKGSSCKSGGKMMGKASGPKRMPAAKAGGAAKKAMMPKGAKTGSAMKMKSGGMGR